MFDKFYLNSKNNKGTIVGKTKGTKHVNKPYLKVFIGSGATVVTVLGLVLAFPQFINETKALIRGQDIHTDKLNKENMDKYDLRSVNNQGAIIGRAEQVNIGQPKRNLDEQTKKDLVTFLDNNFFGWRETKFHVLPEMGNAEARQYAAQISDFLKLEIGSENVELALGAVFDVVEVGAVGINRAEDGGDINVHVAGI